MANAILDLGTVYIEDDLGVEEAALAFTATDGNYIIEVVATKIEFGDGIIYVFVEHPEDESQEFPEDAHAYLCFNLPLPQYNTYQTFKYAVAQGDTLKVAGSGGTTFHVQGILQA